MAGLFLHACLAIGLCGLTKVTSAHRTATKGCAVVSRGFASWYGSAHQGKLTASGEPFDMNDLTAAHWKLKFGSMVTVSNLRNGHSVEVRINDRGPGAKRVLARHRTDGVPSERVIDLSYRAARTLGMIGEGLVPVEVLFCQ